MLSVWCNGRQTPQPIRLDGLPTPKADERCCITSPKVPKRRAAAPLSEGDQRRWKARDSSRPTAIRMLKQPRSPGENAALEKGDVEERCPGGSPLRAADP